MSMRRGSRISLPALSLALLGTLWMSTGPAVAAGMVGRVAPEIALVHGGMFGVTPKTTLRGYRGDVVVLVFWSTGCTRCQRHMPIIQRLHERYQAKGVKTLAIASSPHSDLRRYMRRKGYHFGVGADPEAWNLHKYGVKHYPATFIIGRDGRVKPSTGKLYRAIERELRVPKKGATKE
jgi:peroxiredoxin